MNTSVLKFQGYFKEIMITNLEHKDRSGEYLRNFYLAKFSSFTFGTCHLLFPLLSFKLSGGCFIKVKGKLYDSIKGTSRIR